MNECKAPPHELSDWRPFCVGQSIAVRIAGAILLFAGILKLWPASDSLRSSGLAWAEFCFGILAILLPSTRRLDWLLAVLFALFGGTSLWKFANGESSCGCFGELAVPPLVTAYVDILIVTAMLLPKFHWVNRHSMVKPRHAFIAAVFLLPTVVVLACVPTSPVSVSRQIQSLLNEMDQRKLPNGRYHVLLYRQGFSHCEEVKSRISRGQLAGNPAVDSWVFLEVPTRAATPDNSTINPSPDRQRAQANKTLSTTLYLTKSIPHRLPLIAIVENARILSVVDEEELLP